MARFVHRFFVFIVFGVWAIGPVVQAQTWTGLAAPNNLWSNAGNWDTGVPGSGATALFTGPGNGNTTISLGGTTQPINSLFYDSPSAAAYTIGQAPNDALDFDTGGEIILSDTVTTAQTINANVLVHGTDTSGLFVRNFVSNGGALVGNGLIGLTLGPVNISGGRLTIFHGTATTTTALNGIISDSPGQPGSLRLDSAVGGGAANINSNFIINGVNTYTGGTEIQVNSGTNGSVQIGTDSPFGTGKVRNIFEGNSVEWKALNGTRTIANDIELDGGMNFVGSNSFVLDGSIYVSSGASRTLLNKITEPGSTVSLGASPGSSNIYLGNPTSNGGDDTIGRTPIVSSNRDTTTIVNAVFQDVNPSDPNSGVQYQGQGTLSGVPGGVIIINAPQTYTSPTLTGGGQVTLQFHQDYNVGDPSGPFGLGTFISEGANNAQLTPTGGDRTIANPIIMLFGLTVANAPGDNSSVTFTGPKTFTSTAGRLIQNKMNRTTGGTLTFGSASSPSTFSLQMGDAAGSARTLSFDNQGRTVVNDTIQDVPDPGNPGFTRPVDLAINSSTSTTTFNGPQNTNGNFTVNGSATAQPVAIINGNRTGSGTMTTSGTLVVNGMKTGAGAVTVNSTGTLAGTGSIEGAVANNGRIAPGDESLTPGTLTLTGNLTDGVDSHWLIGLDGATSGKLAIGGNLDLLAVDSLDVAGTGTGSSWVIATYAGTLSGMFDNVTPGYTVDYGSGTNSQITLMADVVGLPGDYNDDGSVDAADYVLWRNGGPLANEVDTPGTVNAADYTEWRARFGNTGSGAGLSGPAVPEPACWQLMVLALASFYTILSRRSA